MKNLRPLAVLCVIIALATSPACVKKSISVRSYPPGASVYIDGLLVGQTPIDHINFTFYGTREIALAKDGYLTQRRIVTIRTPWYSYFPFDIVSELLIPWDIPDQRFYAFDLERTERIEADTLLRHAHQTREIAVNRIRDARADASYRPRAWVVKDAERPFVLWGPFVMPPRAEPIYTVEEENDESAAPEEETDAEPTTPEETTEDSE